jgi:hypothetical protein
MATLATSAINFKMSEPEDEQLRSLSCYYRATMLF